MIAKAHADLHKLEATKDGSIKQITEIVQPACEHCHNHLEFMCLAMLASIYTHASSTKLKSENLIWKSVSLNCIHQSNEVVGSWISETISCALMHGKSRCTYICKLH